VTVGRIVSLNRQDKIRLSTIQDLLRHKSRFNELVHATYDSRMSPHRWRTVLEAELLMLVKWSAMRTLTAAGDSYPDSSIKDAERVLVLLPRYGFALHALRRAVPFAALGLDTIVSVPAECISNAYGPIAALAQALELRTKVIFSLDRPEDLVAQFSSTDDPIFITGRLATWRQLHKQYEKASIFGATGTCSVVISTSPNLANKLEDTLSHNKLPVSCSNYGQTIICDEYPRLGQSRESASLVWRQLGARLRRTHPSVVLAVDTDAKRSSIPELIAGYSIFVCGSDGVPGSSEGFARDPICGWNGDYTV
jgi:hypothetical protein